MQDLNVGLDRPIVIPKLYPMSYDPLKLPHPNMWYSTRIWLLSDRASKDTHTCEPVIPERFWIASLKCA